MKDFISRNSRIIAGVVVVLIIGGVAWYLFSSKAPALGAYTVTSGNVVASVDIPGTVSSSNNVDLSFEESGQIARVDVKEGQAVTAGETLASLDDSTQEAQLSQANAVLAAAQAKLSELESGTRPQVIAIDQTSVSNATSALAAAIGSAYTVANDAIENQTDGLFSNGLSQDPPVEPNFLPTFQPTAANSALAASVDAERQNVIQPILAGWPSTTSGSLSSEATIALADLTQIKNYLDSLATLLNGATSGPSISSAQLATLEENTGTAQTEVNTAITTLTSAKSALAAAQSQLTLDQAGSTPEDVDAQKAAVLQAQAEISSAQLGIKDASIVAPFSGVARNVTAEVGMVVSPNSPVLSLISSNGAMKIDAYASEIDVPSIQLNAAATVTLDAYGNGVQFPAQVAAVDKDETTVNGSPAYHVTLYFTQPDPRIQAGMTGDVTVVTAEHDGVIEVPSRLVLDDNGTDSVLVQNNGKNVLQHVTLGITGNDGMVEIASGLSAGEKIGNF